MLNLRDGDIKFIKKNIGEDSFFLLPIIAVSF